MDIRELSKEIIDSLEERKKGKQYYNFTTDKIGYYKKNKRERN